MIRISYCSLDDVKDLLDISTNDFDIQITKCITDGDNWVDTNIYNFTMDSSMKKTLSRLYTSYLFRTSVFEGHVEASSSLAIQFKEEAENLIRLYRKNHLFNIKKIKATRMQ